MLSSGVVEILKLPDFWACLFMWHDFTHTYTQSGETGFGKM